MSLEFLHLIEGILIINEEKDWSWCVSDGDIDYDVEIDPIKKTATVLDRGWYNYPDEDKHVVLLKAIFHPQTICTFKATQELIDLVRAANDYFDWSEDTDPEYDKKIEEIVIAELRKRGIT